MLAAYHALPYPLRVVAASLKGYQLKSWRYGRELDELAEEALERETWNTLQWNRWQQARLAFVLHRAATQVPYYRTLWSARRRNGDTASWDYLENWPVLEKELLRSQPLAFVADGCVTGQMFHEHTSGTTGKSLDLWWGRTTVRAWYALFEVRCRNWHGVTRRDRWAILGGQLITPVKQRRPPFWVWNFGLNQLYMSSYHLAPDLIPSYVEALLHYRIKYLWGYTSSLYALAQEIVRSGHRDLQMTVVITNAEPLAEYQRSMLSEAFQCPVRETYGMSEIVAAASECGAGHLHQWPEVGIIEFSEPHGEENGTATGEIIATGLLNADMPLIRYRVGDRAAIGQSSQSCTCGRSLPLLTSIEGRVDDLLYTSNGRTIGRLDTVFKEQLPIREAQIIQEALDLVRVKYVPAPEYTSADGRALVERLQERMGKIQVELEEVSQIPRTNNGKFRAVICNLPAEHRPKQ